MTLRHELGTLLKTMVDQGASDLHISVGSPPAYRINGQIVRAKTAPLSPEDTKAICYALITDLQKKKFEVDHELDFAFGFKGLSRLRANFFIQRGSVAAVFRRIESEIRPLDQLGLSRHVQGLVDRPSGLVLVTGATGSGKSTTLAAMIDKINRSSRYHIVTIEDPIEYTHSHKLSLVNQREIGSDCSSFATALRSVLREDPDVIMVGEMRDRETAEAALKAAETGHLVFSTLHTNGAIATINRILQLFPLDSQEYVRSLLAFTLEGIVTQALVPRADKRGRLLVYEYMTNTPAIRTLVRENKLHQAYGQMQIGQESHGMTTLNQGLAQHVAAGTVSPSEALAHSPDTDELVRMIEKGRRAQ